MRNERKEHTARNIALKAVAGASLIVGGLGIIAGDVAQAIAVSNWFERAAVHMDQLTTGLVGTAVTAGEAAGFIGLIFLAGCSVLYGIGSFVDGIGDELRDRRAAKDADQTFTF